MTWDDIVSFGTPPVNTAAEALEVVDFKVIFPQQSHLKHFPWPLLVRR